MIQKFYIDTSIWMDYHENRKDPSKNIGEFAFKFFVKLLASENKILVSTFVLKELENHYSFEEIRIMTSPFSRLIEKVTLSEKQFEEAKKLALERKIPKSDAVHAILSRDNNAILVSRDKHFQQLNDICITVKPEEII